MTAIARVALFGLIALGACRSSEQKPKAAASGSATAGAARSAAPPEKKKPAGSLGFEDGPGPPPAGPGFSREQREAAVLTLLADAELVRRAPLVDLEPGRDFDWQLREKLAPRVPLPRAKLKVAGTKVDGALPVTVAERVVRQHFGRFRLCYEKALAQAVTLRGTVELELVIEPSGRVESAKDAQRNPQLAEVSACITTSARTLEFPSGPNRLTVRTTLELAPE